MKPTVTIENLSYQNASFYLKQNWPKLKNRINDLIPKKNCIINTEVQKELIITSKNNFLFLSTIKTPNQSEDKLSIQLFNETLKSHQKVDVSQNNYIEIPDQKIISSPNSNIGFYAAENQLFKINYSNFMFKKIKTKFPLFLSHKALTLILPTKTSAIILKGSRILFIITSSGKTSPLYNSYTNIDIYSEKEAIGTAILVTLENKKVILIDKKSKKILRIFNNKCNRINSKNLHKGIICSENFFKGAKKYINIKNIWNKKSFFFEKEKIFSGYQVEKYYEDKIKIQFFLNFFLLLQ